MSESFFKNDQPTQAPSGEVPELNKPAADNSEVGDDAELAEDFKSEEGRMAAIMSYIPLLCFIPLLNMPDNKEARLHARQGTLLFIVELFAAVLLVDGIAHFLFKAILIVAVVFSLVGIIFALQGKNFKLPFIGEFVEKTKW
ncbi:MAG TPA: hypothetical protein VJ983_08300 [candidate division Zixibacteria bacterium]|nr:hypothetical protein [candidate division Zixibacteria bacterium]